MAVWGTDLATVEAEALFLREPSRCEIVFGDDVAGLRVVTRERMNQALVGSLGFGRPLLARRSLSEVFPSSVPSVRADLPLADAVAAALARPELVRYDDVLVRFSDTRYGLAPVATLLDALASGFADQALRDPLTGLGNRARLTRDAVCLLADDAVAGVAVFLLDLDHFKTINDELGHDAGDQLLHEVAAVLHRSSRSVGTAFRLGGDEFTALVPLTPDQVADPRETQQRLDRLAHEILREIRGPYLVEGISITVEASLGFAWSPTHGDDLPTLLRRADTAMFEAKRDGSKIRMWEPNGHARAGDLALLADLRAGIPRGELRLYYQPQITVATGLVTHVEALVRWQHPVRGLLAPGAFLPLAETTDVIEELTAWTLEEACRQAHAWQEAGRPVTVSVNLSPRLLVAADLPAQIQQILLRHGLAASHLTLELTESAVTAQPQRAQQRLRELAALGVGISLDDFGTGYTSLAMLKDLPLHELKVDRSFVAAMCVSEPDAAIVHAVAALAHQLNMRVVAEGVEDEQTRHLLVRCGYDVLQGYLCGRPAPADVITDRLHRPGPAAEIALKPAPVTTTTPRSPAAPDRHDTAAELAPFLQRVVDLAVRLSGAAGGIAFLHDSSGRPFVVRQSGGLLGPAALGALSDYLLASDRELLAFQTDGVLDGPPIGGLSRSVQVCDDGKTLGAVLCVLHEPSPPMNDSGRSIVEVLAKLMGEHLGDYSRDRQHRQLLTALDVLTADPRPGLAPAAAAATRAARDLLGADGVTVLLPRPGRPHQLRGHGTLVSTRSPLHPAAIEIDLQTEASAIAIAVRRGTPMFMPDARSSPLTSERLVEQLDVYSAFYLPFRLTADSCGVLAAWWHAPREAVPAGTLEDLVTLAAAAGIAFAPQQGAVPVIRYAGEASRTGPGS